MVKYNNHKISKQDLVALIDMIPDDSEFFVNKLFQLAWLPVDADNPGGVVDFEHNCINPWGVLTKHYENGSVTIHGWNDF
jgi:hypothetical protein